MRLTGQESVLIRVALVNHALHIKRVIRGYETMIVDNQDYSYVNTLLKEADEDLRVVENLIKRIEDKSGKGD